MGADRSELVEIEAALRIDADHRTAEVLDRVEHCVMLDGAARHMTAAAVGQLICQLPQIRSSPALAALCSEVFMQPVDRNSPQPVPKCAAI